MNGENPNQQAPAPASEPAGNWQYKPSEPGAAPYQPVGSPAYQPVPADSSELEWTASEFIAHSKGALWYTAYVGASLLVVAIVYVASGEIVPPILVGLLAIIFGYTAGRPPRTLLYRVTDRGVYIGSAFYPYSNYKAFSVINEGAFSSIMFWPLQRFGFPVGLYYEPQHEDAIVEVLANHLPIQEHQMDVIELLMRKIRF